jgi:hypothetical protein
VPHWLHSLLHWLQWGTVPAWIAAVVAVWSAFKSRQSRQKSEAAEAKSEAAEAEAREQAKLATEAAQDAVAAQERSAAAQERSVDVDETRLQLDQDKADAAERYPWDIQPDGGYGSYRLINKTDKRKYDIFLSGGRVIPGRTNQFRTIDGNSSRTIYLLDAAQVVNRKVKVTWRPTPDHSGERWPQELEP